MVLVVEFFWTNSLLPFCVAQFRRGFGCLHPLLPSADAPRTHKEWWREREREREMSSLRRMSPWQSYRVFAGVEGLHIAMLFPPALAGLLGTPIMERCPWCRGLRYSSLRARCGHGGQGGDVAKLSAFCNTNFYPWLSLKSILIALSRTFLEE